MRQTYTREGLRSVGAVQWAGVVSATVAALSAIIGVAWWIAKRSAENTVAKVTAEATRALAAAETRASQAEARITKAETAFERQLLTELRGRLPYAGSQLSRGETLQQEIESELGYVMQRLGATECSVLIHDPAPDSDYLFFLAAHGPAAVSLRRLQVGPDSIAGRVFRQKKPELIENPYHDPDFSSVADERAQHVTRGMIAIPLLVGHVVVGVAQFLNPEQGKMFESDDVQMATSTTASIALKVSEFVRESENFIQVGLHPPINSANASILYCDLSSSSSLFKVLHESSAVNCINDYLSEMTETVLSAGGSVDQYLGDGAIYRFVDVEQSHAERSVEQAASAALSGNASFKRIKQSWLSSRWEVQGVYSRIAISYGPYREALVGPARHRQRLVLGPSIHQASRICGVGPRDRNIVLVSGHVHSMLRTAWELCPFELDPSSQNRVDGDVFELIRKSV